MDFREIVKTIAEAARNRETVIIYYPKTENTPEGWREIEPYSLANDVGPEGEHVIYGEDILEPGHILNAFTVGSGDKHCDSFILGKIKETKKTGKRFRPRKNWKVEF